MVEARDREVNTLLGILVAAFRAGIQAWLALWQAEQTGRAKEAARANAEAAEAERRAAAIPDQTTDETASRLGRGAF